MSYIELEDALHAVDTVSSDKGIRRKCKAIRKRLKELPTEDVEKVVRCKDCIQRKYHGFGQYYCQRYLFKCKENDYCSYGERKEGAEEC